MLLGLNGVNSSELLSSFSTSKRLKFNGVDILCGWLVIVFDCDDSNDMSLFKLSFASFKSSSSSQYNKLLTCFSNSKSNVK